MSVGTACAAAMCLLQHFILLHCSSRAKVPLFLLKLLQAATLTSVHLQEQGHLLHRLPHCEGRQAWMQLPSGPEYNWQLLQMRGVCVADAILQAQHTLLKCVAGRHLVTSRSTRLACWCLWHPQDVDIVRMQLIPSGQGVAMALQRLPPWQTS